MQLLRTSGRASPCLLQEVRLGDATANGNKAGIESNWLSSDRAVRGIIDGNTS
jgi:hypothetical protein